MGLALERESTFLGEKMTELDERRVGEEDG